MKNRVSHICVIDENKNIYLENNSRLKWLTFIWWKVEEWESFEEWALRELSQETWGYIELNEWVLKEIEINTETVNWILWNWKLYWLEITEKSWHDLIYKQKNIIKVSIKNIEKVNISDKINKNNLINRIKLTLKQYI